MPKTIEESITKKSGSSFYYTFLFLPKEKKKAMHIVYAFCRVTDDIADSIDETDDEKLAKLQEWEYEFKKALNGKSKYQILNSLVDVIDKLKMSIQPFLDLIEGMKMDLTKKRYETFEELKAYCYRVASTIGLISIELFGYKNPASRDYAYNLGIAMQLTNILRDLKLDAQQNRIYIPQEDLKKFNYTENDLMNSIYNQSFLRLMNFQCERAEFYYRKADEYFHQDDYKILAMGRAMQEIYQKILSKIKNRNYDVFSKNNNLNRVERILITVKNFLKYQYFHK